MNKCLLLLLAGLALPAAAPAASRTLVIDPAASRIQIDVSSTLDSFVAHLQAFDAVITLDEGQGGVQAARFGFLFSQLKTGEDDRDQAMYAWAETGRFPDGAFVLTAVSVASGRRFLARGRLRLHGVEREVSFPFTVGVEGRVLAIDGETTLDTRDYGLPIFRKFLFLSVDPKVRVSFHLLGKFADL
jgi:polyisoprenoid-binding protein YceI